MTEMNCPARHSIRRYPLSTVEFSAHRQAAPSRPTIECPVCSKPFFASAIVADHPSFNVGLGQYTSHGTLHCDHCDHLVVFHATCNADGSELHEVVGAVGILRDPKAVARFLTKYPRAAGVMQH